MKEHRLVSAMPAETGPLRPSSCLRARGDHQLCGRRYFLPWTSPQRCGVYNVIFKLGGTVAFQHSLAVFAGAVDPTKTSMRPALSWLACQLVSSGFKDAVSNVIPADLTTMNFATSIVEDPVTVTVGTSPDGRGRQPRCVLRVHSHYCGNVQPRHG